MAIALSKTLEQGLDVLEKAWAEHLPDHRYPGDYSARGWLMAGDLNAVEYAITAAGKKARGLKREGQTMSTDAVGRYITSVLRNSGARRFAGR